MPGDRLVRTLRQRADLKRITSAAFSGAPAASTAITFSRSNDFYIQGSLVGFTDGTGTVTVIGQNSAGDSISVSLVFTGNQRRIDSVTAFRSIQFINTSGLTNESTVGTLEVNAVSRSGQLDEQFTTIRTNIPCRFSGLREDEAQAYSGKFPDISGKVFIDSHSDIRRRDQLVYKTVSYNIRAVRPIWNREMLKDHRVLIISAEDQL